MNIRREKIIMGMTIRVEIAAGKVEEGVFSKIFSYFEEVDKKFSTYKKESEISKINRGLLKESEYSAEMQEIFSLANKTKTETNGYFDILIPNENKKKLDPSGIVKGWAIKNAARILKSLGYKNFYIDAGGDIELSGKNNGHPWKVGIRNPFQIEKVTKVIHAENKGVATSGNYVHNNHIYNPKGQTENEIVSMTIVGPDVYEADRFATAAFAMGRDGILFIENMPGLEGYMVDQNGIATMTTGFEKYVL